MSIMPSHRQGLYLLEHCRVMVKDDQLTYVQQKDGFQKFFAIPFGNTNVLLLGTGTSITQSAARLLSDEGVMLGFTGAWYPTLHASRPWSNSPRCFGI